MSHDIEFKPLRKESINHRVAVVTLDRNDMPKFKIDDRVVCEGYEYIVCPGIERDDDRNYRVRIRRA